MAISTTDITGINLTKQQMGYTHPTFSVLEPIWRKLRDVRWGSGGFVDGTYLVAHPREWADFDSPNPRNPTKKLRARRALASYENFAHTIVEQLRTALFREQAIRRMGDDAAPTGDAKGTIWEWWDNVDGSYCHIDDFLKTVWDVAGTFGHVHLYMDRPSVKDATTAADDALPILRVYTPLDARDWRCDDLGRLTSIKFAEIAPQPGIKEAYKPQTQIRFVTADGWELFDSKGVRVDGGEHQMGVLPVVTLYATETWEPGIGEPVIGDPNLYVDLYNLVSEVRELLRNQTFGILNIPLGTGPDAMTVEQAKTLAGETKGTEGALFSGPPAGFIQPDAANVEVYHAEIQRKLRTIYRLASLAWESDSKDAEALGSIKFKREDMNQRLSAYADNIEKADYCLADLFYRAKFGAEQGPTKLENDQLTIKYPDNFDMTPFDELLEQAQTAMSLAMPSAFLKELRKMLVRKFEGMADLPETLLEEIDDAIDTAPDDMSPQEQSMKQMEMRFGLQSAALSGGARKVRDNKNTEGQAA